MLLTDNFRIASLKMRGLATGAPALRAVFVQPLFGARYSLVRPLLDAAPRPAVPSCFSPTN